jgi:hypothetical protein
MAVNSSLMWSICKTLALIYIHVHRLCLPLPVSVALHDCNKHFKLHALDGERGEGGMTWRCITQCHICRFIVSGDLFQLATTTFFLLWKCDLVTFLFAGIDVCCPFDTHQCNKFRTKRRPFWGDALDQPEQRWENKQSPKDPGFAPQHGQPLKINIKITLVFVVCKLSFVFLLLFRKKFAEIRSSENFLMSETLRHLLPPPLPRHGI